MPACNEATMARRESEQVPVVECRGVTKVYKGAGKGRGVPVRALDDVSLRVDDGTIIIGSHRLGELERLTSDYVFLHQGRIVQFGSEEPAGRIERLHVEFLPGGPPIEEKSLVPYKPLEKSETTLTVAVSGVQDVPNVVSSLAKAGVRITAVALERPDVERTFVRLCEESAS